MYSKTEKKKYIYIYIKSTNHTKYNKGNFR